MARNANSERESMTLNWNITRIANTTILKSCCTCKLCCSMRHHSNTVLISDRCSWTCKNTYISHIRHKKLTHVTILTVVWGNSRTILGQLGILIQFGSVRSEHQHGPKFETVTRDLWQEARFWFRFGIYANLRSGGLARVRSGIYASRYMLRPKFRVDLLRQSHKTRAEACTTAHE